MALLKVLIFPNPKLREKAKLVENIDDEIRTLMNDMLETMYQKEGCGLAATQVGVAKRVIVMDISHKYPNDGIHKMVNPEIVWKSTETSICEEGCLSAPGKTAYVERPASIKIHYLDEKGQRHERLVDHFFATCVQHEIDHLNGKLFIDYPSINPNKLEKYLETEYVA